MENSAGIMAIREIGGSMSEEDLNGYMRTLSNTWMWLHYV